jgi:hypothetical protein
MKTVFLFLSRFAGSSSRWLLAAAAAVVSLWGCEYENIKQDQVRQAKVERQAIIGVDYYVVIIDSCEYVGKHLGFNNAVLAHKGNCKFCAERSKLKTR